MSYRTEMIPDDLIGHMFSLYLHAMDTIHGMIRWKNTQSFVSLLSVIEA
jgi:hypothetical protein